MIYEHNPQCHVCGKPIEDHPGGVSCCLRCGHSDMWDFADSKIKNQAGELEELFPGHVQVQCACGQCGGMCPTELEAIQSFNAYSDAAHYVDEWNKNNPTGTIVTYFPTYSDAEAYTAEVHDPAFMLVETTPAIHLPRFQYGVVTLERIYRGRYLEIDEEVRIANGNPAPGTREALKRARKDSRTNKGKQQANDEDMGGVF